MTSRAALLAALLSLGAGACWAQEKEKPVGHKVVEINGAPPAGEGQPCAEAGELGSRLFRLQFRADGEAAPTEMAFRYDGCKRFPRNDYQPAYETRTYKGNAGYDLLIVTDQGADRSELALVTGAGIFAGALGKAANAQLRDGSIISLGRVTIGDHRDPKKQKTGRAALQGLRLSGDLPTDHSCEPWPNCGS